MRSKSYYATVVGSSFLLLLISCLSSQSTKVDERDSPTAAAVVASSDDGDKPEDAYEDEAGAGLAGMSSGGESGEELFGFPEAADDDGGSVEATTTGEEPLPTASKKKKKRKQKDGCYLGSMRFEGKCLDKRKVSKILDERSLAAMAKVQKAHKPEQVADAAYDLIEQQIAQMDKTEDDLDEMIEQLQDEKREEAQAKKGGRP